MSEPAPKLTAFDLNLLVVFDAVMRERSVTRAGQRIGLSQPAVSHALARLRHILKDDLFVRGPRGMVPTPRAEELESSVKAALQGLQRSLEPSVFEPASDTSTFRIAVENYAAVVLVGALATDIAEAAPSLTAIFRPSGSLDIADLLDRGELDLAIGPFADFGSRFAVRHLLDDTFVAALRAGHPAAIGGSMSLASLASLPHLRVTSVAHSTDFVDAALTGLGLSRRIAMHAPLLSAARILSTSEMVAVLPKRIAVEIARSRPLALAALPDIVETIDTLMIWPTWLDRYPGHRWLRDRVGRAARCVAVGEEIRPSIVPGVEPAVPLTRPTRHLTGDAALSMPANVDAGSDEASFSPRILSQAGEALRGVRRRRA